MARTINRLTARTVATTTTAGYHADGGGLYLQVTATGAKSWIFRYARQGKSHEMGLGPAAVVGLQDARQAALAQRKVLASGGDPLAARRTAQAVAQGLTFGAGATTYIEEHRTGWSLKHATQWGTSLQQHGADLWSLPIAIIGTDHVVGALRPIWATKTETATRVRERIARVLDWAVVKGYRQGENPARWRGHLDKLLPPPNAVHSVEHHPAMPFTDVPAFMAKLRDNLSLSARALEFTVLTACRTGEVIGAQRTEVTGDLWTVPAERMKGGRKHEVPLSAQALAIVAAMPASRAAIFPLSNAAMLQLLEGMGFGQYTVHGFRSSFRDWASETTDHPHQVVEMALAHSIKDKAEAAYRRGALLVKRRALMQAWADFCGTAAAPNSLTRGPEEDLRVSPSTVKRRARRQG